MTNLLMCQVPANPATVYRCHRCSVYQAVIRTPHPPIIYHSALARLLLLQPCIVGVLGERSPCAYVCAACVSLLSACSFVPLLHACALYISFASPNARGLCPRANDVILDVLFAACALAPLSPLPHRCHWKHHGLAGVLVPNVHSRVQIAKCYFSHSVSREV